ncbi:4Fe-4S binding protein, partial [Blautia wexlerae]
MMKHDTAMGVCDADKCSACGVCINICPKGCISYLKKETGTKVAVINKNSCVNCHLCKKVCPQLDTVEGLESFVCYAAWSFDDTIRTNSASGGIATELYRFFSDKGYKLAGVSMTPMHTAEFSLSDSFESMPAYRNSKYVY